MAIRARARATLLGWILLVAAGSAAPSSAVVVTGTSAQLGWAKASGAVVRYQVQKRVNGGSWANYAKTSNTQIKMTGQAGQTVHVRVAGIDGNGALGPWSPVSTALSFADSSGSTGGSTPSKLLHDVDGDKREDITWFAKNAQRGELWLMSGTKRLNRILTPTRAKSWNLSGAADFNGDGQLDLLWHNPTMRLARVWTLNKGSFRSELNLQTRSPAGTRRSSATWTGTATGTSTGRTRSRARTRHG